MQPAEALQCVLQRETERECVPVCECLREKERARARERGGSGLAKQAACIRREPERERARERGCECVSLCEHTAHV